MKPHRICHSRERGVALVTTVIVVAVLAVVAVAFMQSTTTDRLSSRSVANYTRAKLAAEGGAAAAEAMIADLVKRYPDSATVWQNIGGGAPNGTNNEATVLYLRARASDTNLGASPAQFGGEVTILAQPLVSRVGATPETFNTNPLPLSSVVSSVPFVADTAVNINATNAARPEPFVGSRSSTNPGAPITAAQWIYLTQNGGPTNATNPYIARYAFWVEDESFKVNVNVITNGPRGNASLGLSAAEARLDGSWGTSTDNKLRSAAGNVISARASLAGQFPTALTAALPASLTDPATAAELRFLTTTHSAGLDLSRGGFKRFNINTVTNGDKRTGLDRIVAAITNTNASPLFGQRFYRLANNATGLNSASAVSANHAAIYLNKIAANLYDYLDTDDQPTVISNDSSFSLVTGRPTEPILAINGGYDGPNSVAAFGIENGPRLQEFAYHVRMWKMSYDPENLDSTTNFGFNSTITDVPAPTQANFEMWIDYYFEFYNPGTADVTISNAFVQLDKLPAFQGMNADSPLASERSITANIVGGTATFPAGQVTILTTAPFLEESVGASSSTAILTNRSNLVYLDVPEADRKFTGVTTKIANTNYNPADGTFNPSPPFDRIFEVTLPLGPQNKGSILLGNDSGILESFVGLPWNPQPNPNSTIEFRVQNGSVQSAMMNIARGNKTYVRGGSLRGNSGDANARPCATEGDARALNEQLEFLNFGEVNNNDQTRFYSTITTANGTLPDGSTFGNLNTNYVFAANWTDRTSPWNPNPTNAPLYVRNAAMQSIGELGHITDPARAVGNSGNIALARGGGRTLRVGQPELSSMASPWRMAWYNGQQTNASRTWTSWRLADIFTTTTASNGATAADAQGNLTNSLGVVRGQTNTNGVVVTIPGLINPNGLLRDGGAAMKAALYGLTFLPSGPEGASLIAGRSANVTNVVTNLIGRLINATAGGLPTDSLNPFWERGELSELSGLNSASASTVVSGQVMANAIDRGREELIRRSIEMITPRGSVFTVYAIGQTLQVASSVTNVLSTARLRQTFQIEPKFQFTGDYGNDSFSPAQSLRVTRRFSAPTNYTVRIISSSYD